MRAVKRLPILLLVVGTLIGCSRNPTPDEKREQARRELGSLRITYDDAAFFDSVARGDVMAFRLFMAAGMSPETRDPLNRAAPFFLELRRSVTGYFDETLLNVLVLKDRMEPPKPRTGATPLMVASAGGKIEIVQALLAAGVDVNAMDRFGYTALSFSNWQHHEQVSAALLAAGGSGPEFK